MKTKPTKMLLMLIASILMIVPAMAQAVGFPVTGAGDGFTFEGTADIVRFAKQKKTLWAVGTLTGTATSTATGETVAISQPFRTRVESAQVSSAAARTASDHGCDILTLDLGPIFLDVLGLQVDLSAISLDITAVPGGGNLLGNLLCAVANLLNVGQLADIANLLNQILNILEGLGL